MDISLEKSVHGKSWAKVHGGYFSDKSVCKDFLNVIVKAINESKPDVLVDLGGGTGFILSALIEKGIPKNIKLIDLDLSDAQLAQIHSSKIKKVIDSFTDFQRAELGDCNRHFMLIARSILHYVGKNGLPTLLNHIRSEQNSGSGNGENI